jgi:hypothetical protein
MSEILLYSTHRQISSIHQDGGSCCLRLGLNHRSRLARDCCCRCCCRCCCLWRASDNSCCCCSWGPRLKGLRCFQPARGSDKSQAITTSLYSLRGSNTASTACVGADDAGAAATVAVPSACTTCCCCCCIVSCADVLSAVLPALPHAPVTPVLAAAAGSGDFQAMYTTQSR